MGFVQRVLADNQLDSAVAETTAYIANNAPSQRACKAAARGRSASLRHSAISTGSNAMVKACFDSQDYVEGRRAFMEKRKPNFQGR
jgi:enoyl-CoA hydratase/carnithine racemase